MTSTSLFLANADATHRLGEKLGQGLPAGTTLLLQGELGAGKTTLVQGIGAGLGIGDRIVSPTFTLINEYDDGRIPLYHLDLYRLESSEVWGLQPQLYWEGLEVEPGLMVIEWAERLPELPPSYLTLEVCYEGDGRQVTVTGTPALMQLWEERCA
ncbi:tRNA (adenosine(37)-N6)-threonylcarbamoyltransferase complex ATPase subunit type 1 TsaE [Phormidium yuhuli AB48]|uniref:tRNA threonylcarbamoyladenosine biosynthesis protein TsaE n=1 Tax=Phormidium yuhuli AB48 TaxID=2940671 RepID=A0ABY5ALD9_9CYAN|nr:tRNA (adenosine(37)-N6)-threonylcarbamoyltransferase complex ATPase subunit type 1 TsaE [Phormidium yuhuli]USR89957.1 tRNA (adenosine(37)-N6)-threonylcarbamoyltransferase complex ATPase subunit type 1 TsaE [Phormidium yuhuli AB48]